MKKLFISMVIFLGLGIGIGHARGRYDISSNIGPVYVSSAAVAAPSITIDAPSAGYRNCLTYLIVTATNAFTTSILDGSTVIFYGGQTSASGTFMKEWIPEDPICASEATAMVLRSSATSAGNTTMHYSYKGLVVR